MQLMEYKVSRNVYEACTSPLYTLTVIMQISHGLVLIKLNLKILFGKQKQAVHIIFNQDIFTCPFIA